MLGGEGWPIPRESTRDHRKGGLDRMGQARNCESRCVGLMIQSSSNIYLDKERIFRLCGPMEDDSQALTGTSETPDDVVWLFDRINSLERIPKGVVASLRAAHV